MLKHLLAWLAVVVGAGTILAGLAYYKQSEMQAGAAAAQAMPEPREAVEAVRVRRGEWAASTKAVGTVVALRQVEIRNELAGTIVEVGFASGDVVDAGQVLIRFDTSEEQAALAAAQAEARLARLTFERRQALRSSQTVSAQDLDRAREEHAAAVARVATLKAGIDKKTLRAPFRSRVGLTNLQPGAYLDVGTPIAMLQGVAADAYVDFSLPQEAAATIAPGSEVRLVGQHFPDGSVAAQIVAEDASVDGSSRAVRFRALARGLGDSLRPGAFVDVMVVTTPTRPALFVPLTAVRRASFGQHVYLLVEDGGVLRARQRIVQTGPVVGDEVAIVDGLAEGDLVAGAGSFKLREGLMVQADAAPGAQSSLN